MCVCVFFTLWSKVAPPSRINICAYVLTNITLYTHTLTITISKYACMYVHNLVNLKLAMSSYIHMKAGTQKYISNVKELDVAHT